MHKIGGGEPESRLDHKRRPAKDGHRPERDEHRPERDDQGTTGGEQGTAGGEQWRATTQDRDSGEARRGYDTAPDRTPVTQACRGLPERR